METDFDYLTADGDDVHERLSALRQRCPVARNRAGDYYLALRYPAVAEAARNASRAFSAAVNIGAAPRVAPELDCIAPMFEVDGAEHRRWRTLLNRHFTQETAATHEDHVRRLCRDTIALFVGDGEADLVASYTRLIPPLVAAMVLGIPEQHRPALAERVRDFMTATPVEAERRGEEYAAFLSALLHEVEEGSMLGTVARASIGGAAPSPLQVTKFGALMLAAGHLTASDACAGVLLHLLEDDGLRARVAAEPGLLPTIIDERVRHEPAVTATGRAVVKEVELGGVQLVPGDRVVLLWPSANRDEDVFPDGAQFRVDRDRDETGAQQLAWGTGPHQCVGKHIARMEIRVMIEELLAAIPDVRLRPGARPRQTFGVIRGVPELPTIWSVP